MVELDNAVLKEKIQSDKKTLVLYRNGLLYRAGFSEVKSNSKKWAESIQRKRLGNFYKVSGDLYRGEQPEPEGINELKKWE